MTETLKFEAQKRETVGTGSSRAARRDSRIPAVIYGHVDKPLHITLPSKEFALAASKAGFKSSVVTITVDGKQVKTLTREIQYHPVTDAISHVDMQSIDESAQVRVGIPVKFINKDKSPGIKRGGILNLVRRNIEFFCAHTSIPKEIVFDLEGKEIGDAIHINDTKLPEGLTPVIKRNFTVMTLLGKGGKSAAADEADDAAEAAAGATAVPSAATEKAAVKAEAKPAAKPAAKK
jgi:large subunit ribosomal protein L25